MNNLDRNYQQLLKDILEFGVDKKDRTGTGTKSIFGYTIRHNMAEGFPLLTTKKVAFKTMVTELLWFLKGDTNIKFLVENGCHIWTGDAIKNYERHSGKIHPHRPKQEYFEDLILNDDKFAREWGELGPIYGKQWKSWGRKNVTNYDLEDVKGSNQPKVLEAIKNGDDVSKYGVKIEYQDNSIDQIQNLINELKTNPDSRRLMVSAWNVGELDQMVLPPCHYGFQVYTRELSARERTAIGSKGSTKLYDSIKEGGYETIDADIEMHKVCDGANVPKRAISLMWNQRSVDTFLGLPFNIASYGLLLEMLAKEVNMIPDQLIGNLGDVHLYSNHIEQAKEQIERRPMKLPTIEIGELDLLKGSAEIELKNYLHHSAIKAPLSN
jgi:thymidylate synthase